MQKRFAYAGNVDLARYRREQDSRVGRDVTCGIDVLQSEAILNLGRIAIANPRLRLV